MLKRLTWFSFFMVFGLVCSSRIMGDPLEWAGVVGNSGEQGKTLIHSTLGRGGGGVIVDNSGRIFTAGGDRILVLDADGKFLWDYPLPTYPEHPESNYCLGGPSFASAAHYLYFMAGSPRTYEENRTFEAPSYNLIQPNVLRVEMVKDAQPEVVVPREKFTWEDWLVVEFSLTSSARNGTVYLGVQTHSSTPSRYTVFSLDPETNSMSRAFALPLRGGRIALDEHANLFFGGNQGVVKLNLRGEALPDLPLTPLPKTGETLEYFTRDFPGNVIITKDALWLAARMGYLARFSRNMLPAPGVVSRRNYALGYTTQIADGPAGSYYLRGEEALYQGHIDNGQLILTRRFGSLPRVDALAVTPDGYIGVGNSATTTGMLWFSFADTDPAAAPVRAEGPGPLAQGYVMTSRGGESGLFSYSFANPITPGDYTPRPQSIIGRFFTPASHTPPDWPFPKAYGKGEYTGRLAAITAVGTTLFAIDRSANTIVASTRQALQFAPVEGLGQFTGRLTALASLGNNLLIAADGGKIRAFTIDAGVVTAKWQLSTFSEGKELQQFGAELYLAAFNGRLLVADTKRHRVLLFTDDEEHPEPPTFLGQFGVTNNAGDDTTHLSSPTLVSMSRGLAVVYDAGNQRVVKLFVQ